MTPQSPGQTGGAAADVEMSQYVAGRSRVNEDKIRQDDEIISQFGEYEYGWHDSDAAGEAAKKGIDENVVRAISADKGEPEWMLDIRLKGYQAFLDKPMPDWGVDLSGFNADDFKYYVKPIDKQAATWEDLPDDIRNTYDRLGIPEAEKKRLVSGVAAQYESEVIYNSIQQELKDQGVIFVDTDTAVREYPDLVRKYFGTVVPPDDNKFGALNTAAWSGGSFIYVPKGVHVDIPLQAYFRINTPNMGQFERTLIIADEGSYVHYVEGCTAPIYSTDSLHAAIVEIIVEKHARVRYTTVQNWSNNVYNLVTQRAYVREGGTMEWVDGNIGSKAGYNTRRWTKHGKLPYVDYTGASTGGGSQGTTQPSKPSEGTVGACVGDTVTFTGNKHYVSSNALNGSACKPGKAKVTAMAGNAKHPYHLIKVPGGGSTVYGWVDAADIQVEGGITVGSKVKVNKGAKTYTGGGLASFVYTNTYTVIQVDGDRVVIGQNGVVTAAVNSKDLTLVG